MSSEEEVSGEEVSEEEVEEEEEVAPKKAAKRKAKKKKDPNRPKRNQSAFFLYSNANRAKIKAANPDATFGGLAKIISVEYKKLSEKERKKWEKKAAKDKARYDAEMADYVPPSDESEEEGGRKKKKKKDPNKPKRNMSAFFLFSNATRAQYKEQNPDASFGDLAKIISAEYKQLSAKEKAKWEKKAAQDKVRYQNEMEAYNAGH